MGQRITTGIIFLVISFMTIGYASNLNSDLAVQASAHDKITCSNCHQLGGKRTPIAQKSMTNNICKACHESDLSEVVAWSQIFHKDPNRQCAECHYFHDTGDIKTQNSKFSVTDDELTAYVCQTCHIEGQAIELVSSGHREAADKYYHTGLWASFGDSPSQTCLNCHSGHGLSIDTDLETPISINEFASHAFGVSIKMLPARKRSSQIDDKIRLLDNTIECQSCHTLSSGTKDALVEYDNPYDLCNGCHNTAG